MEFLILLIFLGPWLMAAFKALQVPGHFQVFMKWALILAAIFIFLLCLIDYWYPTGDYFNGDAIGNMFLLIVLFWFIGIGFWIDYHIGAKKYKEKMSLKQPQHPFKKQ